MQGVETTAAAVTPDLLGVLRERQEQASQRNAPYVAPVVARDSMLFWLATAAKQVREAGGRRQVHVAASANLDQSSVYRFEEHKSTPRDVDLMVAAYADDLEIDPMMLWEQALKMWRDERENGLVELPTSPDERATRTARMEARRKSERPEADHTEEVASDAQDSAD